MLLATPNIAAIPLLPGFEPLVEAVGEKEHNLVAAKGAARLRLCLRAALPQCPDCLVIQNDRCAAARLAAATRFERATRGLGLGPDRVASPSAYRRSRLALLLDIQDGIDAGIPPRDLAFGLVFPRQRPLAGATWKGSGERRHTLRLIADARSLVTSGYRKLLCHD
ncbi:DUF2285 domain-containing protein [Novosphingobium sp.]|uniref:DUF2285 domain-containing protein n=1 Tax=Novosphingobium sp. TaxID=1874826 RepID=UPI00261836E1|nr:DUF2285 domain-containing protein [Novosphingobium sp.]